MASTIRRTVAAPARRVWATFTDFAGYGRVIPFTRMTHDPGPPGPGWTFTGRTGVGPLRLVDPMRIVRWEPGGDAGGTFTVRKCGPVLAGWAQVRVEPAPGRPGHSIVTWREEIRPARGPAAEPLVGPVADALTHLLFGRAVAGLARSAERAGRPRRLGAGPGGAATLDGVTTLPRRSPSAAGLDAAAVERFLDALDAEGIEMHSLMILRGGAVLAEGWWVPYAPDRRHLMYSLSKSFTSLGAGIAAGEGLFDLDDPVLEHLREFAPADVDPRFERLTIRHCLRMATGHEVDMLGRCVDAATAAGDPELLRAFFAMPPEREPGSLFTYNQLATYTVARIIELRSGQRLLDYLGPRVFGPLGITGQGWLEFDGHTLGFSGLHVPTEAVARLAQTVLHGGRFDGAQVAPAAYVAEATRLQQRNDPPAHAMAFDEPGAPDWESGYGYQFWMSRHGFRGDGAFGQFALMWPELDVAVAITSRTERMAEVMDLAFALLMPGFSAQAPADGALAGAETGEPGTPGGAQEADERLAQRLLSLALPMPGDAGDPRGEDAGAITPGRVSGDLPGLSTLTLSPEGDGRRLDLTYAGGAVSLPVGRGTWAPGEWRVEPGAVPFVSAGGWTPDGRFAAELRMIETPHLLRLELDPAADAARLTWSERPLHGPDPAGFVVPAPA